MYNFICTTLYVLDAIFHGKYPVPTLLPFFVVHLFQFKKCMFLCLVRETSLFMMLLPFVMLQVRLQCLTQKNGYEMFLNNNNNNNNNIAFQSQASWGRLELKPTKSPKSRFRHFNIQD